MNRIFFVVTGLLLATQLYARSEPKMPPRVPVCIADTSDHRSAAEALSLTSLMFQRMGVKLVWRRGLADCEAGSLRIDISENTPSDFHPGAMAYALPYAGFQAFTAPEMSASSLESFHIRVFHDRIQATGERLAPRVFAYVLTHEITHVLQGSTHHAAEGIMKARWTQHDYNTMLQRQLVLTREDIDLLHRGIAARNEFLNEEQLALKSEAGTKAGGM